MSAGLIVAIVVVALVLIALVVFAIPRARRAREQRQLEERRGAVIDRHQEEAQDREARADLAEREAARQRAEADMHQARARVHERGLADDELRRSDSVDDVVARRETFADRERPGREPVADEPVAADDREGAPIDPTTRRPTRR
jgi:type II secretory pathway pseudopilin PulG